MSDAGPLAWAALVFGLWLIVAGVAQLRAVSDASWSAPFDVPVTVGSNGGNSVRVRYKVEGKEYEQVVVNMRGSPGDSIRIQARLGKPDEIRRAPSTVAGGLLIAGGVLVIGFTLFLLVASRGT
jgi:hypothetical protein